MLCSRCHEDTNYTNFVGNGEREQRRSDACMEDTDETFAMTPFFVLYAPLVLDKNGY